MGNGAEDYMEDYIYMESENLGKSMEILFLLQTKNKVQNNNCLDRRHPRKPRASKGMGREGRNG